MAARLVFVITVVFVAVFLVVTVFVVVAIFFVAAVGIIVVRKRGMKRHDRAASMLVSAGLAGLKDVRSIGSRLRILTSLSTECAPSVPVCGVPILDEDSGVCTG